MRILSPDSEILSLSGMYSRGEKNYKKRERDSLLSFAREISLREEKYIGFNMTDSRI